MDTGSAHRTVLAQQITEVEQQLLAMSSRADEMVGKAVEALITLEPQTAVSVLALDDEIDILDIQIEESCLRILALQQPMASDLREIGTVMKIITDVERIGDLSVDIAKAALKIEKELGQTDYVDFHLMASVARSMFRDSLVAFVKRDLEMVASVIQRDDEVDDMYRALRNQIHDRMRESPDEVVAFSWMLLAIHHIERVADHAVNIAERVAFMATGKFEQLAASHKSENTEPT